MSSINFLITPRDPLIARDGHPFGASSGRRMNSLSWFLPSTSAGSLRTAIGKLSELDFQDKKSLEFLKSIEVSALFPFCNKTAFLPAPKDCVVDDFGRAKCLRPINSDLSTVIFDSPGSLRPAIPVNSEQVGKWDAPPAWWSWGKMVEWLSASESINDSFLDSGDEFLQEAEKEERTHVKIDFRTNSAEEGMLFSTSGLILEEMKTASHSARAFNQLAIRVVVPDVENPKVLDYKKRITIGGSGVSLRWASLVRKTRSIAAGIALPG